MDKYVEYCPSNLPFFIPKIASIFSDQSTVPVSISQLHVPIFAASKANRRRSSLSRNSDWRSFSIWSRDHMDMSISTPQNTMVESGPITVEIPENACGAKYGIAKIIARPARIKTTADCKE